MRVALLIIFQRERVPQGRDAYLVPSRALLSFFFFVWRALDGQSRSRRSVMVAVYESGRDSIAGPTRIRYDGAIVAGRDAILSLPGRPAL